MEVNVINKKFVTASIIICILYNIGAIGMVTIAMHGLGLGNLSIWELAVNIAPIAIPLLVLSYFEYRLFKNVNTKSITVKDEIFLWITGVIRIIYFMFTGPLGILNLISAYMVRKELKVHIAKKS